MFRSREVDEVKARGARAWAGARFLELTGELLPCRGSFHNPRFVALQALARLSPDFS